MIFSKPGSYFGFLFVLNFSSARYQESSQQQAGGSGRHTAANFTAVPVDVNALPSNVASIIRNITANVRQGHTHGREGVASNSTADNVNGPEIRIGNNINVDLGGQMPEQLSGTLRTVMEMFTGSSPPSDQQENSNGRSAAS